MDYFQLIEHVFDSPVLYQYDGHRKYYGIKDKAWTKIAKKMKVDSKCLTQMPAVVPAFSLTKRSN